MGMYDTFETDEDLETQGIWIDYGDFRVRIASAGQGNKKYVRYAEKALKPIRRAMQAGAVSNERSLAVMSDIFAKTIVIGWQVKKGEDWKDGIEDRQGNILEVTAPNIIQTFQNLPNLFIDIQEQASSISNFRKEVIEEDSGN